MSPPAAPPTLAGYRRGWRGRGQPKGGRGQRRAGGNWRVGGFAWSFPDRVCNRGSAQAPRPAKLIWHPRRGGRMRAEAGSFRAQETGVHIPLPTPWPPFFPKAAAYGVRGLGTRDSERGTKLVRSPKGRARALPSRRGRSPTPLIPPRSLARARSKWAGESLRGPFAVRERRRNRFARRRPVSTSRCLPRGRRSSQGGRLRGAGSGPGTPSTKRFRRSGSLGRTRSNCNNRWPLASGFDGCRSRRSSCPSTSAGSSSWPP